VSIDDDSVRVLMVEDNPDDAAIMGDQLAETRRATFDIEWVARLSSALERLGKAGLDIILLDLSLPDSSGCDTLRRIHRQASGTPIVVLTGVDDEALGFELLKEGAQDYLVKGQVDGGLLVRAMLYAIERHRLLKELQAAKESAETRLRTVMDNVPVIIFALDREGVFTLSEGKGLEALGREPGAVVGKRIFEVFADVPEVLENARAALAGEPRDVIVELAGVSVQTRFEPVRDAEGEITGVVGVAHDVTERKRLEEQLLQAQKMEAVGRLAGGVAHDFNNLLTAILGYTQMGMTKVSPDNQLGSYLQEINKAAIRASHLTSQLLAFSRRQVIEPRVIDLNDLILDMDRMLRRLIGEDVELVTVPARSLGHVKLDPGQMEQVLMNLAVNARDAMPDGGRLLIETSDLEVKEASALQHPGVDPGEYVMLTVTDTGVGMTEQVKERAFEPFFTTREMDKGTGLGLSTCYGIVAQNRGDILIDSGPGRGTTIKIYLPRVDEEADSPVRPIPRPLPVGNETVLLVEDEPAVREMASEVLREQGYAVLAAANGDEALRVAEERRDREIDLLVTDVVMPLMGGKELAQRIGEIHPTTPVLYTSGYPDDTVAQHGVLEEGTEFLPKPFGPHELTTKVRELLDRLSVRS
jgi:PAS domain S-box-containing protein